MSGPRTDSRGEIQTVREHKGLVAFMPQFETQIAKAVPEHIGAVRMARVVANALRTVRNLNNCDGGSFAGCMLHAVGLGLEPNSPLGHAYLIPRRGKGRRPGDPSHECTLIIGYKGMVEMAYRSGSVKSVRARTAHKGDEFRFEYGLDEVLVHRPLVEPTPDTATHVYAVVETTTGGKVFVVATKAEVMVFRSRSQTAGKSHSPWQSDPMAMWKKTAIRQVMKFVRQSSEVASALAVEDHFDTSPEPAVAAPFSDAAVEGMEAMGFDPMDVTDAAQEAQGSDESASAPDAPKDTPDTPTAQEAPRGGAVEGDAVRCPECGGTDPGGHTPDCPLR